MRSESGSRNPLVVVVGLVKSDNRLALERRLSPLNELIVARKYLRIGVTRLANLTMNFYPCRDRQRSRIVRGRSETRVQ